MWFIRARRRTIVIAGLVGLFSLSILLGALTHQISAPNAGLTVSEQYLHFGEVWEDQAFQWKLPIYNPTNNPISILGFNTSCHCVGTISPATLTIPPLGQEHVTLNIDLMKSVARANGISEDNTQSATREFEVRITPRLDSNVLTQEGWTIRGITRRAISLSDSSVDFGDLTWGQQSLPKLVQISSLIPLKTINVQCDCAYWSAPQKLVQVV
jgi:hypothetical protein